MGATVAICIRENDTTFCHEVMELAKSFGYGVVVGLERAEGDAQEGLRELMECFQLTKCLLLRVPPDAPAPLARGIEDELVAWAVHDREPDFARFLERVQASGRSLVPHPQVAICFAAEWYAGDRVRLQEGTVEMLLALLRPHGTWCQRLFVPASGSWQDVDEVPLVFRLVFEG